MIIRIILILIVCLSVAWFLSKKSTLKMKAGKKIIVILFLLFAIFSVINPEFTNGVAKLVGVGRGADLLLYMLVVAFMIYVLSQYVSYKEEQQKIVELGRKIAILEAKQKNKSENS